MLVARQFIRLAKIVRQGRGVVAPKGMRSLLSVVGRQFRPHAQEDAHEFTRCLVDALQQALLRAHRVRDNTPDAWTSHVFRVFGGFLRSQVRCTSCGYTSNKHDPCMDLALELAPSVTSVERALRHFTVRRPRTPPPPMARPPPAATPASSRPPSPRGAGGL